MTDPRPTRFAELHAAAFTESRPWGVGELQSLLASPHVFAPFTEHGFAIGRAILDEAELLTIAVHPDQQGKGVGRQLLAMFEAEALSRGATHAFLEVAQDNETALALYLSDGWAESGRRAGYYARQKGDAVDAILLRKQLTLREPSEK